MRDKETTVAKNATVQDGETRPIVSPILTDSLPVVEVEFLVAKWEAQADETDLYHQAFRKEMQAIECQLIERAKVYRSCAAELRHYAELTRKREGKNAESADGE